MECVNHVLDVESPLVKNVILTFRIFLENVLENVLYYEDQDNRPAFLVHKLENSKKL